MDAYTDIQPTRCDANQHILTESASVICEHETTLTESPVPENSRASDMHIRLVPDASVVEAHEGEGSILAEHPNTRLAVEEINYEHSCTNPESDTDQVVLPATFEDALSKLPVVPASGSASAISSDALEDPRVVDSQGPPLFHSRMASETALEPALDCTRILDAEPDHAQGGDFAHLTDEEGTRGDPDRPYEDFASSQPPSSSPPQLFSSSPCASSQSSEGGAESSKTLAADADTPANLHNCSRSDRVAFAAQDGPRLETKLPETKDCLEMNSALCVEGPRHSRKRMIYESGDDESNGLQPIKRSVRVRESSLRCSNRPTTTQRTGSHPYLPPTPIRPTLASQNRQFKKLAAPFRPPWKLPVSRNEPVQIMKSGPEPAEIGHDKPDVKELTTDVLRPQHRVSSASRSVSQFKSPLMNKTLPANSRTIRLTPALQALERHLQLLKRAIKVKEDNEEEVLTRLAGKWIEAGREVAYDVWDATKDAGNSEGKAVLLRRSYGWENTNDGNTHWGWDAKPEDADQESRLDLSMTPGAKERPTAEGDDDVVFNNTLGTMLRQLGIAPEIYGWDDDKETFSDER